MAANGVPSIKKTTAIIKKMTLFLISVTTMEIFLKKYFRELLSCCA
jgi:hypothetical protein